MTGGAHSNRALIRALMLKLRGLECLKRGVDEGHLGPELLESSLLLVSDRCQGLEGFCRGLGRLGDGLVLLSGLALRHVGKRSFGRDRGSLV